MPSTSNEYLEYLTRLQQDALGQLKNQPGFFTPYKSGKDFAGTLFSPITAPLFFAGGTLILALATAAAAVACVSCITVGLCSLPFNQNFAKDCLTIGLFSGVFGLLTAACAALFAVLTALIIPAAIVANITRPIATLASKISDCCHDTDANSFAPVPAI